jgi:RNA polymerase sigma-70 factor (ECF subfamily)
MRISSCEQTTRGIALESQQLAAALGRREESALTELYDRYGRTVYALTLRILGDPGMAEEISLDAFWQVWQQIDRFNEKRGSLPSWLFTIARSRAIDRLRSRVASKRTPNDAGGGNQSQAPDEAVELAERRRLVHGAMAKLSAEQRSALELAYFEGLSHSEISARLNQPLGTVKTRIRQAMIILRRHLEDTVSASA